jgi:hypothetical protein
MTTCVRCGKGRVRRGVYDAGGNRYARKYACDLCHRPLHKQCSIRLSLRPCDPPAGKWTRWNVCEDCALRTLERLTGVPA